MGEEVSDGGTTAMIPAEATGLRQRAADRVRDRDLLLDMHAEVIFACAPAWERMDGWDAFRERWLASGQGDTFLAALADSLGDPCTMAEVVEAPDGAVRAYLWVRFVDVPGHGFTYAEIDDLWVAPASRRQGLGTALLQYAGAEAGRRGASRLRSGTGVGNAASIALHRRAGFTAYRLEFERPL